MKASRISVVLVVALLGVVLGLGGYTFTYAKGWSYVTDDPAACANCHVMNEQYEGWTKSSHRSVAVCNDCHVPHDFVRKYATKARNGFWHSLLLHDRALPRADSRHAHEPPHRGGELPPVPWVCGGCNGHTGTRRIA